MILRCVEERSLSVSREEASCSIIMILKLEGVLDSSFVSEQVIWTINSMQKKVEEALYKNGIHSEFSFKPSGEDIRFAFDTASKRLGTFMGRIQPNTDGYVNRFKRMDGENTL